MSRVFFYVQHLLGIGHLRRAAVLARTLAAQGFDVLLVSGGAPVGDLELGGARFAQLPPLRARDAGLRELAQLDGAPVDDAFRARRIAELAGLMLGERPDIVVTEQFPFGRTRLRFELVPLLETARALPRRPKIFASVRDVLRDTVNAERVAETLKLFDGYFDGVLVHADPKLITLEQSFAGWAKLKDRAHYTGYVVERDLAPKGTQGSGEVIVSVGGGAVGGPLLEAALAARPKTSLAGRTWRLLLGASLDGAVAARLKAAAGKDPRNDIVNDIVIEPARADFTTLLANATLSISQAGYNTVVETLSCADRAVLVPFATERETEQSLRARAVAERGLAQIVEGGAPNGAIGGDTLAAAVERALAAPSIRSRPRIDVGGAAATASFLKAFT